MVNWLTVLLSALGGTAGAAVVLAALWKFLGKVLADRLRLQLEHENNEKIENLRAELNSEVDRTQKLLDASVQKSVLVTRTQFETEFNAYKEIYAALCEVKDTIIATRPRARLLQENESKEEEVERLNIALEKLTSAHHKANGLKDNLAPFYAPDVYSALHECLEASGCEIFEVRTAAPEKLFTRPWFEEGTKRQEAFQKALEQVQKLIRERIASLGITEK